MKRVFSSSILAAFMCSAITAGCQPPHPTDTSKKEAPVGPPNHTTTDGEFSIMAYNVLRYCLDDRDRDGQHDNEKSRLEKDEVQQIILEAAPDVLALSEMGSQSIFDAFQEELKNKGLDYPYKELAQQGDSRITLALLSKYPITSRQSHLDDRYTIAGVTNRHVSRGYIDVDIEVNPTYAFRILTAHLKSKRKNKLGQTEMRRNEARLLHNHVKAALKDHPDRNLIVVGDLNDGMQSAALKEVLGPSKKLLFDIRPSDWLGDTWTHFRKWYDDYSRIDYILLSKGMRPELVPEKSRVIRYPVGFTGSDHRPLMAVFKATDLTASEE